MSLIMLMEFVGASRPEVKALAQRAREVFGFDVSYRSQNAIELNRAHSALADGASWDTEYWALVPAALAAIEAEVRTLHQLSGREAFISALWAGESARDVVSVSIEEMTSLIRDSHLGTHTKYRVAQRTGLQGNAP